MNYSLFPLRPPNPTVPLKALETQPAIVGEESLHFSKTFIKAGMYCCVDHPSQVRVRRPQRLLRGFVPQINANGWSCILHRIPHDCEGRRGFSCLGSPELGRTK